MLQGQFDFDGKDDNIFIGGQQATFVEGIFSDQIDVAYIELSDNRRTLSPGDGTRISGFMDGL